MLRRRSLQRPRRANLRSGPRCLCLLCLNRTSSRSLSAIARRMLVLRQLLVRLRHRLLRNSFRLSVSGDNTGGPLQNGDLMRSASHVVDMQEVMDDIRQLWNWSVSGGNTVVLALTKITTTRRNGMAGNILVAAMTRIQCRRKRRPANLSLTPYIRRRAPINRSLILCNQSRPCPISGSSSIQCPQNRFLRLLVNHGHTPCRRKHLSANLSIIQHNPSQATQYPKKLHRRVNLSNIPYRLCLLTRCLQKPRLASRSRIPCTRNRNTTRRLLRKPYPVNRSRTQYTGNQVTTYPRKQHLVNRNRIRCTRNRNTTRRLRKLLPVSLSHIPCVRIRRTECRRKLRRRVNLNLIRCTRTRRMPFPWRLPPVSRSLTQCIRNRVTIRREQLLASRSRTLRTRNRSTRPPLRKLHHGSHSRILCIRSQVMTSRRRLLLVNHSHTRCIRNQNTHRLLRKPRPVSRSLIPCVLNRSTRLPLRRRCLVSHSLIRCIINPRNLRPASRNLIPAVQTSLSRRTQKRQRLHPVHHRRIQARHQRPQGVRTNMLTHLTGHTPGIVCVRRSHLLSLSLRCSLLRLRSRRITRTHTPVGFQNRHTTRSRSPVALNHSTRCLRHLVLTPQLQANLRRPPRPKITLRRVWSIDPPPHRPSICPI